MTTEDPTICANCKHAIRQHYATDDNPYHNAKCGAKHEKGIDFVTGKPCIVNKGTWKFCATINYKGECPDYEAKEIEQ